MLSRTAEGLFWIARYVERMENVSRLLDAGRRLDNLPRRDENVDTNEWTSIVIASGASTTFPFDLNEADRASVSDHLIRDENNPSSIVSCVESARMNAKAVRNAISVELWEAINDTRTECRNLIEADIDQSNLSEFLDWVRTRAGLTMGKIESTLLRDDGYGFIELGKWFERADATARLLDVKYHVLLPEVQDVGGGLDYLQWVQILRAANSAVAFRHLYRRIVDPKGVVDLLVLNAKSPRSLIRAMSEISHTLQDIISDLPEQKALADRATGVVQQLMRTDVDQIFNFGLHDWLTEFIIETNNMAAAASSAFGFGVDSASQSQESLQ